MDYLREGIGLRAYSQRDPLVEYQREGFDMFNAMMDGIKEETVGFLFNLEVQVEEEPAEYHYHADGSMHAGPMHEGAFAEPPGGFDAGAGVIDLAEVAADARAALPKVTAKGLDPTPVQQLAYSAPDEQGEQAVVAGGAAAEDEFADVGRNALCPCGSGKKYKRCHGAPGGPTGLTARVNG
jgi:preprotein translocase subunit SecA